MYQNFVLIGKPGTAAVSLLLSSSYIVKTVLCSALGSASSHVVCRPQWQNVNIHFAVAIFVTDNHKSWNTHKMGIYTKI